MKNYLDGPFFVSVNNIYRVLDIHSDGIVLFRIIGIGDGIVPFARRR